MRPPPLPWSEMSEAMICSSFLRRYRRLRSRSTRRAAIELQAPERGRSGSRVRESKKPHRQERGARVSDSVHAEWRVFSEQAQQIMARQREGGAGSWCYASIVRNEGKTETA